MFIISNFNFNILVIVQTSTIFHADEMIKKSANGNFYEKVLDFQYFRTFRGLLDALIFFACSVKPLPVTLGAPWHVLCGIVHDGNSVFSQVASGEYISLQLHLRAECSSTGLYWLTSSDPCGRAWEPGPCLNIKTVFPRYGDSHVKDKTVVRPSYL